MKSKKSVVWLCGAVVVLLLIVGSILLFQTGKKKDTVVVGLILPGAVTEEGWNGTHYQGVKEACDELGLRLEVSENVAEYSGDCEKEIRQMAKKGIRIIILESFYYPDEVRDVIREYPEISFYCCSEEMDLDNYKFYFARMYQARYLSGIVAGMKTETNHIGYVAAMDNYEVNRGINAFTLGVQRVNPDAVVHVSYTGAWDDEEKEKKEAVALVKECGADVLTYHQNQSFVVEAAVEMGISVIGYNLDKSNESEHLLTTVVCHWDQVYQEILRDYLQNKNVEKKQYWIGIEEKAVGLESYSANVSEEIKEEVERALNELSNEKEVFEGPIYDQTGALRCNDNEVVRDEVLMTQMDWLVEGVEVYEVD